MRQHGVFIAAMLTVVSLCFASGLLKGAELLITSGVLISLWLARSYSARLKNAYTNILLLSFSILFFAPVIDIGYHIYLNNKANGERINSDVETIYKFIPNKMIEGPRYGDLAEMGMLTDKFPQQRYVKCQIDELGYRNPIGQKNKKNRIILIGDSFGFGAMSDGENIADYLRKDYRLETYNLSLPGYGPWQEHYTLREEIDKITNADTCTVVWLLFTGNDLAGRYDSVNVKDRKATWRDDFYSFRKHSPMREGLQRVFYPEKLADVNVEQTVFLNDTILYYKPYQQQELMDSNTVKQHRNYSGLLRSIDNMAMLTKRKNVTLYPIIISAKEGYLTQLNGQSAMRKLIGKRLKQNGLDYFIFPPPNKDALINYYLYNDTHLNSWGNITLSRLIVDYLVYKELIKESQLPSFPKINLFRRMH